MFLLRLFRKYKRREEQIEAIKQDFHRAINQDINRVQKMNKALSNGVSIKLYHVAGGKHGN